MVSSTSPHQGDRRSGDSLDISRDEAELLVSFLEHRTARGDSVRTAIQRQLDMKPHHYDFRELATLVLEASFLGQGVRQHLRQHAAVFTADELQRLNRILLRDRQQSAVEKESPLRNASFRRLELDQLL